MSEANQYLQETISSNPQQFKNIVSKLKKLLVKKQQLKQQQPSLVSGTNILIGNFAHSTNFETLKKYQVRRVISCVKISQEQRKSAIQGGIQFHFIIFKDHGSEDIIEKVNKLMEILKNIPKEKQSQRILIGCFSGKSRSVALAIGLLMKKKSITFEEASKIVSQSHSVSFINSKFQQSLAKYYETILLEGINMQAGFNTANQQKQVDKFEIDTQKINLDQQKQLKINQTTLHHLQQVKEIKQPVAKQSIKQSIQQQQNKEVVNKEDEQKPKESQKDDIHMQNTEENKEQKYEKQEKQQQKQQKQEKQEKQQQKQQQKQEKQERQEKQEKQERQIKTVKQNQPEIHQQTKQKNQQQQRHQKSQSEQQTQSIAERPIIQIEEKSQKQYQEPSKANNEKTKNKKRKNKKKK